MIDILEVNSKPVVAAHRGYKAAYPENTLLAFKKALELGIEMLELDLHLTKDNEVVIIHDETLERTTNGTGKIGEYTLEELRQLDAGLWFAKEFSGLRIPTLKEFCELIKPYQKLLLNVEIKPAENAVEVVDEAFVILKEYGLISRCVFTSFDAKIIAYLHDTYNQKTQGFIADSMFNYDAGEQGTYSKMWSIAIPMNKLTPEIVKKYKNMSLLVWCFCPDTEEQAKYALECGVTLMTCNNPMPAMQLIHNSTFPL